MSPAAPAVSEGEIRALGRTEGRPETLARLVAAQHTRRLVVLRAVLDAASEIPGTQLKAHWELLEAADRADAAATRRVLYYPLLGPWLLRLLRAPADGGLGHLGAVACAAAVRSGLSFSLRLPLRAGRLTLPALGAVRSAGTAVELSGSDGVLSIRPSGSLPATVRPDADGTWRSDDPRWSPVHMLPGGPRPVPLDDLDPYRTADSGLERHGLKAADRLAPAELARWRGLWADALPLLRLGGEHRTAEAGLLLDCLVPLAAPPLPPPGQGRAHCSGTRREAFGAVLSSTPHTPATLASTLVHELQHTKLSALADLVPLHTAGPEARHWAPWRPDPRPFGGLVHGVYSHLGLADYWQRLALSAETSPAERDMAWVEHSRCREQVGAVLPTLLGSAHLTPEGRVLVSEMAVRHARLRHDPPPDGYLARAASYVETSRTLWRRQNAC
jgi:HEXXH motif-containing protein